MRMLPAIALFLAATPACWPSEALAKEGPPTVAPAEAVAEEGAQDEKFGIRLREWYATLEGKLQAQGELIPSFDIDVDDELGIDDPALAHEIQLSFGLGVRITVGAWTGDWKGDRTVSQTFTFADETFAAGTNVDSELELDVYYASFEYGFATPSLGSGVSLQLGVLVGARILRADGSVDNEFFSAQDSGTGGLPVVGLHAAVQFAPWLRTDMEVMGLAFSAGGTSASYIEGYVEVVGQLYGLFAGVGYKIVEIDLADHRKDSDFDLDLTLAGVYFTVGARF